MKMFLIFNMILITFIIMFLKHPLSMGLMILLQTLMICLISGMIINTYWFSYILFLTFLGGLLVLFIYISSIASNELLNFHFKKKIFFFICIIYLLLFFSINKFNWSYSNMNYEMNNLFNFLLFFNNENNMNLSKLYNKQNYMLMLMLIIYLFITLIAVVKISNIFFGPLRSFN